MTSLSRRLTGERGQVLWIGALLLPILLGMTGMAMDIGGYAAERRSLQKSADAIALASAQALPNEAAVRGVADAWAAKNDVDLSRMTVTISGGHVSPAVTVRIDEDHEFSFMRVLGIDDRGVSGRAVAAKFTTGSANGVVPWSITQETVDASVGGDMVVVKYDSQGPAPGSGNFGAIRIDGSGSNDYEDSAKWGSDSTICAVTLDNCDVSTCNPGVYPDTCAEDAPECDGPECDPKTGNMTGATRRAVDFRMDNTSNDCDTFEEVVTQIPGSDSVTITPACNPWGAGACEPAPSTAPCSRRLFLIPVVDEFGNGSSDPVTIQGFALVYLEGYEGTCTGSSCDIRVRFVQAELTTGAFAAEYDPDAFVHFVKLIE